MDGTTIAVDENGVISANDISYVKKSGATMEGILVAQSNTNYAVAQVRNVTLSTESPSGGSNGQIHCQYT